MRRELEELTAVNTDSIPHVLGELEELRARLTQRLVAPLRGPDRLMTAEEVAARLHTSVPFVYSHQDELGACRLSERMLRFRESDVERYVKRAAI